MSDASVAVASTASSEDIDARPTRWRRGLLLVLPCAILLLALALTEGALRLCWPHLESLDLFVRSPLIQDDLEDRAHVRIFAGDPLLFWRLRPNLRGVLWDYTVVSTNVAGLRADGPLLPKKKGSVRILCLGDSVTFGFRVPLAFPNAPGNYDHKERPYPALLGQRLRDANPGRAIDVVNMAVPGYSSHQALAWLRRDVERLAPDLVTICLGWNDVSPRELPDRMAMPVDAVHVLARRVVGSSQLLLRLSFAAGRVKHRLAQGDEQVALRPRATEGEFVANVLAAARVARAHHARVVVIAPIFGGMAKPTPEMGRMTAYRNALRAAAANEGVAWIEIPELTEAAFPTNAELFPTEAIHPGIKGHRLLAQALLRFLDEEKMLGALGLSAPPTDSLEAP